MIRFAPKTNQNSFADHIESEEFIFLFIGKKLLRNREWRIEQKKWKESFLTALATAIKKDSIMSIKNTLMNWKSTRQLWRQQLNKI